MTRTRTDLRPSRTFSQDPDQVNHLVCCREPWKLAFCGWDVEHAPVNLRSRFFCAMCLEVVRRLRPSFEWDDPRVCPRDGTPCPDEFEIDARIAYETS